MRDRVQHHAKTEDENGNERLTNIIWGMSIKPNLAEDEMEVVVVATGVSNENLAKPIIIKNNEEQDTIKAPVQQPQEERGVVGKPEPQPERAPMPKYRPAPAPITRPSRNFAEFAECKRVPAYIAHGISLTVAAKAHQAAGVEKEQQSESHDMPALF